MKSGSVFYFFISFICTQACPDGCGDGTGCDATLSCQACYPGKCKGQSGSPCQHSPNMCSNCLFGKYTDYYGATACLDCPVGTYSVNVGSTVCPPCRIDYYCLGGLNQFPCPENSQSPEGSRNLTYCKPKPGYFKDGIFITKCGFIDMLWYYCPGDGNKYLCPGHSTTDSTGTKCILPNGYYLLNGALTACRPGFFCMDGVVYPCPANASSPSAATSMASCWANIGHYEISRPCEAPFFTCYDYPLCEPNHYCEGGNVVKKQCPWNSSSPAGSHTILSCMPDTGFYRLTYTSMAVCDPGYYCLGFRSPCAIGTYNTAYGQTSCLNCDPGTFQSGTGKSFCQNCTTCAFEDDTCNVQKDALCCNK